MVAIEQFGHASGKDLTIEEARATGSLSDVRVDLSDAGVPVGVASLRGKERVRNRITSAMQLHMHFACHNR